MNSNNFLIVDGEKIYEEEIPAFFPLSVIKYKDNYAAIIEFIVQEIYRIDKEDPKYAVAVNLLASKSLKIKHLTIVIEITKICNVEAICFDFISAKFKPFFDDKIKLIHENSNEEFIDKSEVKAVLPKYLVNLFFSIVGLIIRKKGNPTKSVIRAWVDVDEKLHKNEFSNSTIFIYPFGINLKRSYTFIKKVFSTHSNVRLIGVNYQLLDALKVAFSADKLNALIDFELNGMKVHSKYFKKYSTIYTSDEFQVATPILYQQKEDATVINRAHGMGCYNLIINYTEFYVFNDVQKEYYKRNNLVYKIYNSEPGELIQSQSDKKVNRIVYIDQGDLNKYNYFYETKLQNKVLKELNDINEGDNEYEVFVKYHPNRSETEIKEFNNVNKLASIKVLDANEQYLFINLYSTSYFDFKKLGSFIFVSDDHFSAKYFFGDSITRVHIDQLKSKILNNDA
jgi:hypothetical protein